MNKKKVGATVATLGVAAAVLLTGTYAYQSLNQEALNEASGVVNPGGRLHDDFNYDKDVKRIYVENFGDQNIYARIQLSEYMEKGTGAGKDWESDTRNVELVTASANYNDKESWAIHYYDKNANETNEYMSFDYAGSSVPYMPTFNMNKDSLKADINGTYKENYNDYVDYSLAENATKIDYEIFDADTNTYDEFEDGTEVLDVTYTQSETEEPHNVSNTLASCIMSMNEWNNLPTNADLEASGEVVDESSETKENTACWVYDDDGWAYWSKPITPNTATGTLINDIDVKNVDDNWFYALNAKAQFITADDLGRNDGTGFYDDIKGTAPTQAALDLLTFIGVDTKEVKSDGLHAWYDKNSVYSEQGYLDETNNTLQFYAAYYKDGEDTGAPIEWAIEPEIEGVSISETGLLTVDPAAVSASRFEISVSISGGDQWTGYTISYGEPLTEPEPLTVTINGQAVDFNASNELNYKTGEVITLATQEGYENATYSLMNATEDEEAALVDNGDGTATFTVPEGMEGKNWEITVTVPFGEGSGNATIIINWIASDTDN